MKRGQIRGTAARLFVALTLACAAPVLAQTGTGGTGTTDPYNNTTTDTTGYGTTAPTTGTTTPPGAVSTSPTGVDNTAATDDRRDDSSGPGWLGLLGLAGLFGLRGRRSHHATDMPRERRTTAPA